MSKRTSTLQHSKLVERQVVRFLAGPEAARDWKDLHDISVLDNDGRTWYGEVKDYSGQTLSAGGGELSLGREALAQVEATRPDGDLCFAWLHRKRRQLERDWVAVRVTGAVVFMAGEEFRARWLGLEVQP